MTATRPRLATRLMVAQAIVVGIGAVTLVVTAMLVAPSLFHDHLTHVGVSTPDVQMHAEEAFASSFGISVAVATVVSLLAAGLVSWFLVRRVSQPVEELALAAQGVAAGNFGVDVPDAAFSRELHELSESFTFMAQRLSQSESTRTRLMADLAHELRTPLATLEAYIDGMEDDVVSQDAVNYDTMRLQIDRLRRLANDLREVAAADEHALGLVLSQIDAREMAATAVAAADPRYQSKGVGLALANSLTPCWIMADSDRLQQVLANLLDNALRHTPSQGQVSVQVESVSDLVQITVRDNGDGIPEDQLASIFERFHRADPSRVSVDGSGSGLGLTIARAIVAAHGGTLEADSAGVGAGATIRVELPLDARARGLRQPRP